MPTNIYTNGYVTLRMPATRENGDSGGKPWHPKFDLNDYGVPKEQYKRHYKFQWYRKGRLHFLWETLLSKFILMEKPSPLKVSVELACRTPLPDGLLDSLLKTGEVSVIDTPEQYKF